MGLLVSRDGGSISIVALKVVEDCGIGIEDVSDDGGPHPHAVLDLIPVTCPRVGVEGPVQFVSARKRVQDRQIGFEAGGHVGRQPEAIVVDRFGFAFDVILIL